MWIQLQGQAHLLGRHLCTNSTTAVERAVHLVRIQLQDRCQLENVKTKRKFLSMCIYVCYTITQAAIFLLTKLTINYNKTEKP